MGNYAFVRRAMLWGCLAVCLSAISLTIDAFYGQGVNLPGLLVGILTYAPLAVILASVRISRSRLSAAAGSRSPWPGL